MCHRWEVVLGRARWWVLLVQRVPRRTLVMALANHTWVRESASVGFKAALFQALKVDAPEGLIEAPSIVGHGVALPALLGAFLASLGASWPGVTSSREYPARVYR